MVKRRLLQRIGKGKYLVLPLEAVRKGEWTEHEFIIASHLIEPYYIGFRSALNCYGYTEQVSRTVFVVSPRQKLKPALEISEVTYRFVYMDEQKFFGATQVTLDGYRINNSEQEKTIIDCLDRLDYSGGIEEIAKGLSYGRDDFDFVKLARYAQGNGNSAVSKRMGYLLEILELGTEAAIDILHGNLSNSYALLNALSE